MERCKHDKEKGREKKMRKLGSTEKTMTRARREIIRGGEGRRGKLEILVGQVTQATCSLRQFVFFNLTARGGGFSACPDPQWEQCAL